MLCWRHSSAVVNPASPCFRIAMICSSLCRVPFIAVLLFCVWENSHSKRSSFWGLGHGNETYFSFQPVFLRRECERYDWLIHEWYLFFPAQEQKAPLEARPSNYRLVNETRGCSCAPTWNQSSLYLRG